jgi:hypothetical protein
MNIESFEQMENGLYWNNIGLRGDPHNIPAKRFALMVEMKHTAIEWHPDCLPYFGTDSSGRCDIAVCGDWNANNWSHTFLGNSYINDTGVDGDEFFTGSQSFKVNEIEVFEITNSTALPRNLALLHLRNGENAKLDNQPEWPFKRYSVQYPTLKSRTCSWKCSTAVG